MIVLEISKLKDKYAIVWSAKYCIFSQVEITSVLVMFDRISNTKPKVFIRNQEFLVLLDLQGISIFDNRLLP